MPAMKRPAAASVDELHAALHRPASAAAISHRCEEISELVMRAGSLPEKVRQMLCAGIAGSFGVPKDKRMPMQETIIGWVSDALADVLASARDQKADTQSRVDNAEAEKERREAALAGAKEFLSAKADALSAKKEAAKEATVAVKAARARLGDAEQAQREGDSDLAKAEGKKAELEDCLDAYKTLCTGAKDDVLVEKIMEVGSKNEFDASMITALPSAFNKPVESRGQFDTMVLDQFQAEVSKRIAAQEELLTAGAPLKAERAAAVEAAKVALEAAIAAEATSKTGVESAQEEHMAADAAVKEATKSVREFASDMKAAEKDLHDKTKDLAKLQKDLEAFREMLDFDGSLPKAGSQYRHIGGMRFERELLALANEEPEITRAVAERLYTSAMDGPGVTPTEKRTLKYITKKFKIQDDARQYLETKMGSSWYQVVDGVKCERLLLSIAEEASAPLGMCIAERLWTSAMDYDQVTQVERQTLEKILATKEFEEDAKKFLTDKLAECKTVLEDLDA